MSCSKIFSGDLPELTSDIIKCFRNDFSTLHSCILVNRLWCRLAIPLLWENPFSIPTENYDFIEIYLNHLINDLKSKSNEYKINDNSLPSNTLFNYPSFIKYLDTSRIFFSIEKWLEDNSRYFLQNSSSDFRKSIYMSLFKLFIENESKLHFLDVEVTKHFRYNSYLDDILELMLQNPNFVHNIKNLELRIVVPPSYNEDIKSRSIKNRISQVINSYQILRKIVLGYDSFSFYNSLLLSNNCSNTLSTIIFYHINFEGIINLDKIFEQLNVLKSVHIIYCSSLNTEFIQQIINLTKPFKLKSLFINGISQIESLKLLLQKSGDYLENFGYGFKNNYDLSLGQQLLESVLEYCENIKFFDFYESKDQLIFSELNLIENIKQNLNYLSIDVCNTLFSMDAINRSSIILQNLGQILPIKLEYLCLTLNINIDDFELFLKNSQDTFIKKLLIDNRGGHNILFCVKENIMKRERVNYLAIVDVFFDKYNDTFFEEKDLFLLKDEVKEFESYNIKIQEYNDLIIRPTSKNFAKELD